MLLLVCAAQDGKVQDEMIDGISLAFPDAPSMHDAYTSEDLLAQPDAAADAVWHGKAHAGSPWMEAFSKVGCSCCRPQGYWAWPAVLASRYCASIDVCARGGVCSAAHTCTTLPPPTGEGSHLLCLLCNSVPGGVGVPAAAIP